MDRVETARLVARLLARIVLGVWVVATLAFAAIQLYVIPALRWVGDAPGITDYELRQVHAERVRAIGIELGDPLPVQYVDYLGTIALGDLGSSMQYGDPVRSIVGGALGWTALVLVLGAATAVGFLLLYTVVQTRLTERGGRFSGRDTLGIAAVVPWYFVSFVAILVFGYWLEALPTGGRTTAFLPEIWSLRGVLDVLHHAALPSTALGFGIVAYLAVAWGRETDLALHATATRRARVRGLSNAAIRRRYVLSRLADGWRWNGLTVTGWVLGYAVLLEEIFSYRGLGWYLLEGLSTADYPLIFGAIIGLVVLALVTHAVVDLVRSQLDLYDGPHLARSFSPERDR